MSKSKYITGQEIIDDLGLLPLGLFNKYVKKRLSAIQQDGIPAIPYDITLTKRKYIVQPSMPPSIL